MAGRNAQQSRILHSAGGTTGSFDEIEEVHDVSGPDGTANTIDVTHLRSTAKEYLAGLGDFGQIQMTCNYVGGTKQLDLLDMFSTNADPQSFILVMPTSAAATTFDTFAFSAGVTQWSLGAVTDDKQTLKITLKVTGTVTMTPNTSLPT